jgi:hypothetical protein
VNVLPSPWPSLDATTVHVEDEGQQRLRDAEAAVLDTDHGVAVLGAQGHANLSTWRRVFDRVGHDVGQHLLQPHRVTVDPDRLRGDRDLAIDCRIVGEGGDDLANHHADVDWLAIELEFSGRDAFNVDQVVDQVGNVIDLSCDHLVRPSRGLQGAARDLEQSGGAADRAQRVPQLVRELGQEFVLGAALAFCAVAQGVRLEDVAQIGHDQVQAVAGDGFRSRER